MPVPQMTDSTKVAFGPNHVKYRYLSYRLEQSYQYDGGFLSIPIGYATPITQSSQPSARQAQEIIQVTGPSSRRVVTFSVSRLNAAPMLPAPIPKSANGEVLTESVITPAAPSVYKDGVSRIYSVSGTFVFEQMFPQFPSDPMGMGSTDVDIYGPDQFIIDSSMFEILT